jgi:arginase family enzyme
VLVDAHLDYRDRFLGLKHTNNRPFRRARKLPFVKRIVAIGARGIKCTDLEYRESLSRGNLVIAADGVSDRGAAAIAAEIGDLGNPGLALARLGLALHPASPAEAV